ncbi:MAG: hypothetical protein HY526_04995 [Betaproteobacteria bacterium]|nr:hypothetical protein [Betaproteobacteria bacterium]
MQTVIQVVCKTGRSMRDAVANDPTLEENGLKIVKERKHGRSPGWTKVKSAMSDRRGTVNVQWNASTSILMCRIVNRGAGKPNLLVGDFVDYLLARHKKRVRHITIWAS